MAATVGDFADEPLVSVVCVTYNHEAFIEQALESFLTQKTSFSFEVLVTDDCSTDRTREILKRYARLYPYTIRLFLPEENLGAERNLIAMCKAARGRYVALCDGDDYWTRSDKLQLQVDYMEAHPQMRACFHDTEIVLDGVETWFLEEDYRNTSDGVMRWCTGHKKFVRRDSYSLENYIDCGFVHSSAMFFRWDKNLVIPEWFYHHILGDYTLWCIQVGLGSFGFIDETLSVYRRHDKGGYNFASRQEFWLLTRPDWLSIDEDLKGYFAALGAPDGLLRCFDLRKRDDLKKLLKATAALKDRSSMETLIAERAQDIHLLLDVPLLPGDGIVARCHNYYAVISMVLPQTSFKGRAVRKAFKCERVLQKKCELIGLTN